mgnify:CR=1 FL=1
MCIRDRRTSVAQFFPGRQWFYHLHRRSWGKCVYDAARHQVPVLRTNCTYFPVDMARYRPRPGDDAPLAQCPPWTTAELGACQGFPLQYSWPPRRTRCRCRFCSRSSVSAASKQIGNAIPGVIARWGIETMLAVMAPGRWRRAAACLRCARAARRAAGAAVRARAASAAASHAAAEGLGGMASVRGAVRAQQSMGVPPGAGGGRGGRGSRRRSRLRRCAGQIGCAGRTSSARSSRRVPWEVGECGACSWSCEGFAGT